ncbi:Starch-binding associating with outer membrane [Chitinophaga sp. CF118]|uniref:SusD/RagB family nutrient-binding outer membrane lipoprotein n=1 Tax=Chitinophaga sp. CF118 TaxID=1884367 RepID=UPI0008DF871B|nr:SusD/RagB family nutrient-binding outer membrane lipoprotein [Chitinophaga sp. CF118]SFD61582.1 Starch-binding associating with outer membrane [Chitinophaga sp. CF118]
MKNYIWGLFAVILFTGSGCKKFLDVNKNPNNPEDVQESLILSPVEVAISDFISAGNAPIITQNYVQAIAANQPNPNIGNYQLFNIDLDGDWFNVYVTCLNNLRILSNKGEKDSSYNYAGIAKILSAYTLGTATDLWGDIPYSKGFTGIDNLTPAYDKQEDIYKTIQSLLSAGIADIAKNSIIVPGTDDFFYEGDMSKWTKLAYVLKARYFMHLSKVQGSVAADSVLEALNNGMESNDDDFAFKYKGTSGAENPWFTTFGQVTTYVMNATFVDWLKDRNDPRLSKIVKPADSTGLYTGRTIGTPTGILHDYSYPTAFYAGASADNYLVNYSEALFLKAEATLMKSGATSAQPFYQEGIISHMQKLSVTQANINTYLTTRGTLTTGNALQLIMEEKNVADFLNAENFVDWRRTGFPTLTKVDGAISEIPRRLLYPQSEILTNEQPQQTAKLTDRIWWDVQ